MIKFLLVFSVFVFLERVGAEELPPVFKPGNILYISFTQNERAIQGGRGSETDGLYKIKEVSGKWVRLDQEQYQGKTPAYLDFLKSKGFKRWLDIGWINSDYIVNAITEEDFNNQNSSYSDK